MKTATLPRLERTLHLAGPPFMHGPDVKALQRALAAAGLLPVKACDGFYGAATAHACELAKRRLGYPKALIHAGHECAGDELLALLQGRKRIPLAWRLIRRARLEKAAAVHPSLNKLAVASLAKHAPAAVRAARPTKRENAGALMRAKIVAYCNWAIANTAAIHYAQTRPMDNLGRLQLLPQTDDCSEFATKACKFAGAADPNGLHYNGQGYTGTLLAHCEHVPQALAKAGDLAVFGAAPGHHVVVLLEDGAANRGDPNCASHGQEKGPMRIRLKTEAQYQPSQIAFLRTVAP